MNDSGFKSSPLFKHALNNAIDRLEGKINDVSEGDKPTSKAGCSDPKAPETSDHICETYENTCEGNYTCVNWSTCQGQRTCMSTCANTYCGNTCEGTCATDATCEGYNTCSNTCENTCSNCPPVVYGYVSHFVLGYWSSVFMPPAVHESKNRRVFQPFMYPYASVGFREDNGYYWSDKFGQPSQTIKASCHIKRFYGENWQVHQGVKMKPHQNMGNILRFDIQLDNNI